MTSNHEENSFLRVSLCSAGNIARLRKGLMIIKNYMNP